MLVQCDDDDDLLSLDDCTNIKTTAIVTPTIRSTINTRMNKVPKQPIRFTVCLVSRSSLMGLTNNGTSSC